MKNMETNELTYWHSSNNNAVILDNSFLVNSHNRFHQLKNHVVTPNGIVEAAYNARPNTKYVLWEVTNLTAYVTHMGHMLLGANDEQLAIL